MSKRLRAEDITVKPRIYMDGETFRVEYYGPITKGHCGVGFPTLAQAVKYANKVALRNPQAIKAINRNRFWERQARLARKAAVVDAA